MKHYFAIFEPVGAGEYGVSFPDFPGCVSAGEDFHKALQNATEALAFHVEGMQEDGDSIPEPGALPVSGYPVVPVQLLPSPGKSVRIQVTIDARLLTRIDAVTTNRSGFLADAAAERLDRP